MKILLIALTTILLVSCSFSNKVKKPNYFIFYSCDSVGCAKDSFLLKTEKISKRIKKKISRSGLIRGYMPL